MAIVRGNDTTNRRPNQLALVVQTALQSHNSPSFTLRTHGRVYVDHRARMSTFETVPHRTRLASSSWRPKAPSVVDARLQASAQHRAETPLPLLLSVS